MTIQHFNRLMGSNLDSSSVETIGGLLLNAFGELPSENSCIVVAGYEFAVDALADQKISKVTVRAVEVSDELPDAAAAPKQVVASAPGANPKDTPARE
jgi:magnesium and cobalt transporter